ncbi:MAG TPA: serine hydrolase [Chloroflexia bacterium]|nr:serine hydrolase [Chloroflexia bacterium]
MYKQKVRFLPFLLVAALAIGLMPVGTGTSLVSITRAQTDSAVPMLYGSAPDSPDSQLQALVEDVVGDLGGDWGVAVKKLDTGQYAAYNGDEQHVSASLYKMWVLCELFRQAQAGIIDLDGYEAVTGSDAWYDASLGDLNLPTGTTVSLRRAAYLMITVSDNTAAALLVRVLGPDNINRFMRQNGLNHSLLDWSGIGDNLTTPIDVLHEMELIATSQMVDAEASRQMIEIMLDQQVNNLLAPGLPEGTPFAHKHGNLGSLLHNAGIVWGPSGPFVIVAMSSNLDSYTTAYDNMPVLMERVYNYFNNRPASPALYFPTTRQSVGHDFLKFWNDFGGMAAFGYPIGPEQMRNGVLAQQFERARFEWHPEIKGAGGLQPNVTLGLVGQERITQLGLSWPRSAAPTTPIPATNGRYFGETGQALEGIFYNYWANHGGERIFGYPLSPAIEMVNPSDGKTYLTQWFQRSRMELHPELPPGQRVVLGALGTELATFR